MMKKIFIITSFLFSSFIYAQDSTFVRIDTQGDGTAAYEVSKFKEGILIDKQIAFENPNKPNWKGLKLSLFNSQLFYRALTEANPNVYSTMLKVLTDGELGYANEQNFLMLINMLGMTFKDSEKSEINIYFKENGFKIRL